ncbi:MAG: D-inositol-3-phosphate glycosyltransferase [Saprospiraceae bacterium]|jgi:D-inositol-3-phosphate glycosyltransferase
MIVKCFGGLSEMCPDGKIGYMAEPTNTANRDAIFKFYNNTDHEEMQRTILEEKYS